jgi:hypothetical protein
MKTAALAAEAHWTNTTNNLRTAKKRENRTTYSE